MILFGRKTYRKMVKNLASALSYNPIAIPLAAGVLYPTFILSPAMGAVLRSLSTVIVAFNARLLKLQ
jgi:Cu2+-exporting ATPase